MLNLRWSHASCRRGSCVIPVQLVLTALLASHASAANLTLRVSNEIAPSGGWAQIKISAAAPAMIANGRILMSFDPAVFGGVANVAVFSAAGDAEGVAVLNGQSLDVNFNAPSAGIGRLPDLPVLTVTIPVLANAPTGVISAITLDASQSPWMDANGNTYSVSVTPGSVTTGGSLSVQNLVPGGGLLAAGTLVRINGTGFSTATTVSIAGVSLSNTAYVSPAEIDVTLGGAADLTGKRVVPANSDGSQVQYFSSIPSAPDQAPANFTMYEPLLSMQTWTSATVLFPRLGGIALQNPNPVPVDVTLQTRSPAQSVAAETRVTVPAGALQVYYTGGEGGYNAFASLPLRMVGMAFLFPAGVNPEIVLPESVSPTVPPPLQLTAVPAALTFNWQVGTAVPALASVYLEGSNFPYAVTLSGPPFIVESIPATVPGSLTVAVNPVGLSPGSYNGAVTITPEGPNAVVTTIPLSLTVSASALLYPSSTSLALGGPGDSQGILSITSNGNPIPFAATASSGSGANWLSVSPSSATTPAQLTVSASSTGLSGGVYNGQIVIGGPNNTLTVPVQLTLNTSVQFSPSSVTFSIQAGSAPPAAQTVAVYGPTTGVAFSAATNSGVNWLNVSAASGPQSGAVISVNPTGLAAGIYSGTVTATSPASTAPASIPVSLVIWNQQPALTAMPSSVTFAIPFPGTAEVPAQTLQITSGGVPLNFTTTALAGAFVTPASIPVYAQPGPNLGAYEYNVSITSRGLGGRLRGRSAASERRGSTERNPGSGSPDRYLGGRSPVAGRDDNRDSIVAPA